VSNPVLLVILGAVALGFAMVAAFLTYAAMRYAPIIGRIFEEKPLFLPLRLAAEPGGEDVRFSAEDGIALAGTYYRALTGSRAGVLVFCHEYLSDRKSFQPYLNPLRSLGFDVFTFDFRSHGESAREPNYTPLQWVTDHEVRDLTAALGHVRSRHDADPAGVGLFGVSRGGGVALVVAAQDPTVWGVITDGAFPTRGTMLAYILRWAEIYVSNAYLWKSMPLWVFRFLGSVGRTRSEKRLNCRYSDVEKAVSRLGPRPWLMIHGEKDAYIMPDIARKLFALASEPKELWIVPKAKHNRCREVAPDQYLERVSAFLRKYAPRRPTEPGPPAPVSIQHRKESSIPAANGARPKPELTGSSVEGPLAAPVAG
jgi:pimeloyl-ACP methyl ester carboxylesterase